MERTVVHEVFAQIFEGEVKNIIVCSNYIVADNLAKTVYGPTAFAVDCLQYPIGIGDKYHDGRFWRVNAETGVEESINPVPTEEQQVQVNEANIRMNHRFAKETFELLSSLINMSAVTFSEHSTIVQTYGEEYVNNDYDLSVIPNIGNLLSVILSVFGTKPTA